jgi:glycosyltransferase involved in cell wall biosynthesis
MKILWLAHRDPQNPRAGGAEKIILEVGRRLVSNGHEVTIFSGGWKNCQRYELVNGLNIYRFGFRAVPHLILPVFLSKRHFDLIIADLGHAVPWFVPVLLRKKTIISFHHLHARSLPGQVNFLMAKLITVVEKLYFFIYRNQSFVTVSITSMQDLIELGINPKHVTLIHPGMNSELFHPCKKTEQPSIVYYGGMRSYKRPEEAIYLLSGLLGEFEDVHLTMVGTGIEIPRLELLVNNLNLISHVTFKGRLSDEELSKTVSESWLNVHSSTTEGWGISIIEAAAAGTPTVAYNVPGVSESIENGMNGLTVPDGDRNALRKAAITILSDHKSWSLKSIEVAKKYSWEITANLWQNFILKVTEESK